MFHVITSDRAVFLDGRTVLTAGVCAPLLRPLRRWRGAPLPPLPAGAGEPVAALGLCRRVRTPDAFSRAFLMWVGVCKSPSCVFIGFFFFFALFGGKNPFL